MSLKKPVSILVVADEQPDDGRASPTQVGKEAAAEQVKISGRDRAGADFLGES